MESWRRKETPHDKVRARSGGSEVNDSGKEGIQVTLQWG